MSHTTDTKTPNDTSLLTPTSVNQILVESLNSRNLEPLMSIHEDGASLILRDGRAITGLAAIRAHYLALFPLSPKMEIAAARVISSPGLAVLIADWRLTGTTAGGEQFEEVGRTYDVVREQADGTWRAVFDSPWGGRGMETVA